MLAGLHEPGRLRLVSVRTTSTRPRTVSETLSRRTVMADTPRIYVACLAAYNAGTLHGEWLDADQSAEELHEAIRGMLSKSPKPGAEEWAIHDYHNFGDIKLSEHESLENVAALAELITEHDGLG